MAVPYNWSLPYWGGLASPIASKSKLYNAWMNTPTVSTPAVSPLEQLAATNAAVEAKKIADSKVLADSNMVSYQNTYLPDSGGIGVSGPSDVSGLDIGYSPMEGYGLGPAASGALSAATSVGLGLAGVPGASTVGGLVGAAAGKGLTSQSLGNMAIGKGLSAINPALGLAYGLASMFGLNATQGLSEMFGFSDVTPGFEGGFFGEPGVGQGVTGGISGRGDESGFGESVGGYGYGGETAGSVGVGAENAGADSIGGGIGGVSGAGVNGTTAGQAPGGMEGPGPGDGVGDTSGPGPGDGVGDTSGASGESAGNDAGSSSDTGTSSGEGDGTYSAGGLVQCRDQLLRSKAKLGPLSLSKKKAR